MTTVRKLETLPAVESNSLVTMDPPPSIRARAPRSNTFKGFYSSSRNDDTGYSGSKSDRKSQRSASTTALYVVTAFFAGILLGRGDASFDSTTIYDITMQQLRFIQPLRFGARALEAPRCIEKMPDGTCPTLAQVSTSRLPAFKNVYKCDGRCSSHATCFLGECMCHPGYSGPTCDDKMEVANPWYTSDCPNLAESNTLDITRTDVGGVKDCPVKNSGSKDLSYCAYLCYSSPDYGTAIIPTYIWKEAQVAEDAFWKARTNGTNDRMIDHWQGFKYFECLPTVLGHVAEFGTGPWTQFRGILHNRPEMDVKKYTVIEPGADFYIKNINTCAYKTGKLRKFKPNRNEQVYYSFPVEVISEAGEAAMERNAEAYDTVMVANVIEHVQNAVEFLHGIHRSLKPGGLLIFHDRFFETPPAGDAVLGRNVYHPIRLNQKVFDHFLSDFDIIFNNCEGHLNIDGWMRRNKGERGYYVIARKKLKA